MNKESLIKNIEYCSIEHAASLLECSIADIEHFLLTRAIGCYVFLNEYEAESDLLLGKEGQDKIDNVGSIFEDVLEELICTELSSLECINVSGFDSKIFNVSARLYGLWSIVDHSTIIELLTASSTDVQDVRFRPTTRKSLALTTTIKLNDVAIYVYGFNGTMGVTRDDIKILGNDLLRLYGSLGDEGEPLPNIYNNKDLRIGLEQTPKKTSSNRAPRTETVQSDMIKALLCLLPDLKEEIDRAPTLAPEVLDAYLEKNGLARLNLGDNNYKNWMKRATYTPER
ncbi:hypothetical protein C1S86_00670 [Vibrio parahaemolyticus]|uniref:hypothetical protein n=1 Tax=Vibrio parahaemolyticus TaxID=670 RepID=UPI00099241EB|nr:hypothetical protein [Vibrio parahaemolyticus]OOQ69864.1 hypothetical protein BSR61_11745 [Vibrio parahaemolyticus]PMT78419.1 hypothetical protein C1S97_03125 [Vibrio parahaemolyticus]PMT83496.1 hypothetical protein C1S86_00670 [Vibrio parahaemolyticus]